MAGNTNIQAEQNGVAGILNNNGGGATNSKNDMYYGRGGACMIGRGGMNGRGGYDGLNVNSERRSVL